MLPPDLTHVSGRGGVVLDGSDGGYRRVMLRSPVSELSVVPGRATDAVAARAAYDRDGAVVVPGVGAETDALTALVYAMFEPTLRSVGDHVPVRATGGRDRPELEADGHTIVTPLHSDGFALADGAPDVLVLGCVHAAADGGGASFLADVDGVFSALVNGDDADRELADFLLHTAVDQTEPGKVRSIGPIGVLLGDDRVAWRRALVVRPCADDPDAERTVRLLAAWDGLLDELTAGLTRFALQDGDALVVDNTRLFHGRDPYGDTDRLLWRFWAWTERAVRPDAAYPGSDTSRVGAG